MYTIEILLFSFYNFLIGYLKCSKEIICKALFGFLPIFKKKNILRFILNSSLFKCVHTLYTHRNKNHILQCHYNLLLVINRIFSLNYSDRKIFTS